MAKYSCEVCGSPIEKRLDVRYEIDTIHCKQCYQTEEAAEYLAKKKSGKTKSAQNKQLIEPPIETDESEPFLSGVLWILAMLSLISGVFIAFIAWPETSSYRGGMPFPMASIVAIISGVVCAVVFFALGQILSVMSRVERKVGNQGN